MGEAVDLERVAAFWRRGEERASAVRLSPAILERHTLRFLVGRQPNGQQAPPHHQQSDQEGALSKSGHDVTLGVDSSARRNVVTVIVTLMTEEPLLSDGFLRTSMLSTTRYEGEDSRRCRNR